MKDSEFRAFVDMIGPWFDGMAKFVGIVNRHVEGIYSGEQHMLERLRRHTQLVDKYMSEIRVRFAKEDEASIGEISRLTQNRLVNEQQVGKALQLSVDEFWKQMLTANQRQEIERLIPPEKFLQQCLIQPIHELFSAPHRLSCLDDSLSALLLREAIYDGVVSVQIDGGSTCVIMDGDMPRLEDAYSIAELLDCGTAFVIDFSGFQIVIEGAAHVEKN